MGIVGTGAFKPSNSSFHNHVYPNNSIYGILFFFLFFFYNHARSIWKFSGLRGRIRAAAASLHHSHSNTGSESHLQPTPQLMAMPDLCLAHWVRSGIKPASSWLLVIFLTQWATTGTPSCTVFIFYFTDSSRYVGKRMTNHIKFCLRVNS